MQKYRSEERLEWLCRMGIGAPFYIVDGDDYVQYDIRTSRESTHFTIGPYLNIWVLNLRKTFLFFRLLGEMTKEEGNLNWLE